MDKLNYSVNNWIVDYSFGSIVHQQTGERRRLGEYQLRLLTIMLNSAGKIFTRVELTQLVWEKRVIGDNSLSNAIHSLRIALEDDGRQQRIIKTIPRKGYLLDADYRQLIEEETIDTLSPITLERPTSLNDRVEKIRNYATYMSLSSKNQPVNTICAMNDDSICALSAGKKLIKFFSSFLSSRLLFLFFSASCCLFSFIFSYYIYVHKSQENYLYSVLYLKSLRDYPINSLHIASFEQKDIYSNLKKRLNTLDVVIPKKSLTFDVVSKNHIQSFNEKLTQKEIPLWREQSAYRPIL